MRPIILSGFMATGKSTLGPRIAARLGVPFVDTDDAIAREAGLSVPELWKRDGEGPFREREAVLVRRLLDDPKPQVIAFGGGTVTHRYTRHLALERATLVTLTASPATIAARVSDLAGRPNLATASPAARAADLLEQRADAYGECHLTLATDDLAKSTDALVDAVIEVARREPLAMPLGTRSYDVDVCVDEPARLRDAIVRASPSSLVLVTDDQVERARGDALARAWPAGVRTTRVVLPAGERHKTLASVSAIWDAALGAGVDRSALLVAFGGGVVGDLAGFAAATLLRGIRFIQVPTTLLSMVDASVGGKTGFDHATGKNLIGAFHQPTAVVADLAHLTTLDARERNAGLAEVVKVGLGVDGSLFDFVEREADALRAGDPGVLATVVRRAIAAKIRIVRDDEFERGARVVLNVGHTVGHALEAHGAYTRYLHGEAVAVGMVAELRASAALGVLGDRGLVDRVRRLLGRFDLPTDAPAEDLRDAWSFVGRDKKRAGASIVVPLIRHLGGFVCEEVPLDTLRGILVA